VFERAEKLGMTVAVMSQEMPYGELLDWMALDAIRNAEQQAAQARAKKGMRAR
jgi:hypothetical protein